MKYKDIKSRRKWELSHRKKHSQSIQVYELASDLEKRQIELERKIQERRDKNMRLTKHMRSYVNSKTRFKV